LNRSHLHLRASASVSKLREAEVLISQGKTAAEASRALNIGEQTYYRWRKDYDGLGTEQAHRLNWFQRKLLELLPFWKLLKRLDTESQSRAFGKHPIAVVQPKGIRCCS